MPIGDGIQKGVSLILCYLHYKIIICMMRRIFLILNDPLAFLTVTTKVEKFVTNKRRIHLGLWFSLWRKGLVAGSRKNVRLMKLTPCLALFLFFLPPLQ